MAKMWTGRFAGESAEGVNDFNSSISFDSRMYHEDIAGSIAHATMLAKCGIISSEDCDLIIKGLNAILSGIETGEYIFDPNAEDVHMWIEEKLTLLLGDTGKKLHTARSRNDQVALDTRLYVCKEIGEVAALVKELIDTLVKTASQHTETVMCGYTHLQRAQPITFAHHLMAYAEMLLRDTERLKDAKKRAKYMPLGACALAGTTYPIDRRYTASLLGFDNVCANSLDAVSDRDFCLETVNALEILMVHMSRFAEEIILWCSWEFKYIELDDAYATGSSIMPQKKNPDIAELVRGKCARVIGDATTLATVMKGLPLAYNKDMQEDKEALFDAIDNTKMCVKIFIPMLATMRVLKENMYKAAGKGFINATDCADYLTKKGVPFRDAYKITGELVALAIKSDYVLENLPINVYKSKSELFEEDIYAAVDLFKCVNGRLSYGGPAKIAVEKHISEVTERLKNIDED